MEPPLKKRKIMNARFIYLPNDILCLIYSKAKTSLFMIRSVHRFGRDWGNETIGQMLRKRFSKVKKIIIYEVNDYYLK